MTEHVLELKQRLIVGHKRDGRACYDRQAKQELIAAGLRPGVSVARLALVHGINANLLRTWIRKYQDRQDQLPHSGLPTVPSSAFVPVVPVAMGSRPQDPRSEIVTRVDNLRVHHSKPVRAWVAQRFDKIELFFYLPSYSPELNPEERLNADIKHAIGSKVPVRTKAKLKAAATEHMTKLEQSPERVKQFFQDPNVKYAA